MRLITKQLNYSKLSEMKTEVLFEVASARAAGYAVVRFDVPRDDEPKCIERSLAFLARILRAMKKRGAIQFFVTEDGFMRSTTEARFLLNMYPEVEEATSGSEASIFVKL